MELPTLASQDIKSIEDLARKLPQSLIIQAEPGLSVVAAIDKLTTSEPSDIYHIGPEDGKNLIGVEQIRTKLASLTTFAHNRRIVIVEPAENMTPSAQNALLKTLEEPNAGLHFILIPSTADTLLPTIYSRCHTHTLHRTSSAQDRTIVSATNVDATTAQQILFLASGRPALIRQLATTPKLLGEYQRIAADAKGLISARGYERLSLIGPYLASRDQALRLMDILLAMIKFQLTQGSFSPQLSGLAETASLIESSLHKNANVKTALLRLI